MLILTAVINWFMLCVFLSMIVPEHAVLVSIAIVVLLVLLSTTEQAEKLFRYSNGFRRATQKEASYLLPILNDLCTIGNIQKVPKLYFADNPLPNAYALGSNTVCVTRGLFQCVPEEEIRGVIAHELGHLQAGDSKKSIIAHTLNTIGNIAAWLATGILFALAIIGSVTDRTGFVAILLTIIAVMLKAGLWVMQKMAGIGFLAIGRKAEFAADNFAFRIGEGVGLLSFLYRIQDMDYQRIGLWARLEATHPPVALRIDALEQQMAQDC